MAEQYEEDDFDVDTPDLVKDLRRQLKALSKEKAELASELSAIKVASRERSVADVLAAKGISEKVAKFIPADVEGGEALEAWLSENAEVFGFTAGSAESGAQTSSTVNAEDIDAAKRLQSLSQASISPSVAQDLETRLKDAKSPAEIQAILSEGKKFFL